MRSAAFVLVCVAVLVAGCGSTGRKSDPNANVVKEKDLPARHRAVLEAWKKGGAAWEIEREEVRKDPELARFVVDNLVLDMVQAFDRSRLAPTGHAPGPFERAQAELIELHDHSTELLAGFVGVRDGVVAFLAADTLEKIGAEANEPVAKLLDDPADETRRRAAELLGKLPPQSKGEPQVLEALGKLVEHDKSWIVRAQSARALGSRGARQTAKGYAAGVLNRAMSDEDETVASSAAQALGELNEPRAIPRLIDAMEASSAHGRPALVKTIQTSLSKLAGDTKPRDVRAWRAWWSQHEAEMARPAISR
jgi:HEAT repeat protein